MRTPADEFGKRLRELRRQRGIAADKLSVQAGAASTLVAKWEREPRTINKTVLQRIATALELVPSERQELFRLADMRNAPEDMKHLYEQQIDGSLLLFEALLSIPHRSHWDFQPEDIEGEDAGNLVDAIGWVLATIAATRDGTLNPFTQLRWPDRIIELGVAPRLSSNEESEEFDPPTRNTVLEGFGQNADPLSTLGVYAISRSMAAGYRDFLFRDRERAAKLVSLLEHWEHHYVGALSYAITLRFRQTTDDDQFGFCDIGQDIVERYGRDRLALTLWDAGRCAAESNAPDWSTEFDQEEYITLHRVASTKPVEVYEFDSARQLFNADYMMRSPTWPYVVQAIRERHGTDEDATRRMEDSIRKMLEGGGWPDLSDALAEPWKLATIDTRLLWQVVRAKLAFAPDRPRPASAGSKATLSHSAYKAATESQGARKPKTEKRTKRKKK